MTTTVTTFRSTAVAAGVAPIPFTFQALSVDEIAVYRAGVLQTRGVHYSVALNGDGTGSITPLATWGADAVDIRSNPNLQQLTSFTRFAPMYPDQFVAPLDRLARTSIALAGNLNLLTAQEAADIANVNALISALDTGFNERVRDTVGNALVGTGGIIVTPNDAGDQILIDASGFAITNGIMPVATVADMKAIPLFGVGSSRFLYQSGRKGVFTFSSTNFATLVAADPLNGVLIAPNADPTGASGAWIRQVEGFHNVKWWGAVGDNVTNDGPAFAAALVYLKAIRITSVGITYNEGTATLFVPRGKYFMNATTLDLTVGLRLLGESLGELGGQATQLRWVANTPGIRVQRGNTTGDTGANAGDVGLNGGDGSIIEKLALIAAGGADAEYNAILCRARATIRDCYIVNWQGDGIQIRAFAGAGGSQEGNANNWEVSRCAIQGCRNGLFVDGDDANAGHATLVDAISNRQWGIFDSSFLGNTYTACHVAGNTVGAYKTDNINARNVFIGCYSESGQPTSVFVYPTIVIGGLHGAGVSGVAWITAEQGLRVAGGNLNLDDALLIGGDASGTILVAGAQSGAATDSNYYFDHNNSFTTFTFRRWVAGVPTTDGTITVANATGGLQFNSRSSTYMLINGGIVANWDSTGLNLASGMALKYNGAAVLTAGVLTAAASPAFTGDVTKPSGSLAQTIAANAVTYAKMQTVTAARILGNPTGGAAVPSEISLSADLAFSGSALQLGAFTGDITKSAGSLATTIGANLVTYAKFQQVAANSLVGNPTGSLANAQGITLAGGLAFSGTTLTAAGPLTPTSVAATGAITSTGGGVGYATGAGGTVTQLTSRTTGVTLNKLAGAITLFNTTTTAGQISTFTVTNSQVAATDTVNLVQKSGLVTGPYIALVTAVAAGSFNVTVYTPNAVAADAPVFQFTVTKGTNA